MDEFFYLDRDIADVNFEFPKSVTEVPRHKVLLSAESDVSHRMFYGSLALNGDVTIGDSDDG